LLRYARCRAFNWLKVRFRAEVSGYSRIVDQDNELFPKKMGQIASGRSFALFCLR
jgi:hypothetical protein